MTDLHRRRRPAWLLLALAGLCALCLAAAGCGSGDEKSGSDGDGGGGGAKPADASFEFTFGVLAPLTGDLSPFGPSALKAAKLAVEETRSAFQANGVKVELAIKQADTETKPQAAQQAARKLISDGANCLIGPYSSGESIPVAESVSRRQGIPTISPSATSAELTTVEDDGYFFRTPPSDTLQTTALADLIEKTLGGADKKVSIGARNDAYGEGIAESFKAEWEKRGGSISGTVLYDPEQPSYNTEARQIVGGEPDAIMIADFPETWTKMGAAVLRTGQWDTDKVFSTDAMSATTIPEGLPVASLEGVRGTRGSTSATSKAAQSFDELYKAAGGVDRYTYDAQLFDATILCALSALAAGSSEGEAVRDELAAISGPPGKKYTYLQLDQAVKDLSAGTDIDYEGVSGPIDLDENGDPTSATYDEWRYVNRRLKVEDQANVKSNGG